MKFGKTYGVLLPSFPEDWQERAISYGQLKKLINNVVGELSHLGLDPGVLNQLLRPPSDEDNTEVQVISNDFANDITVDAQRKGKRRAMDEGSILLSHNSHDSNETKPRALYELTGNHDEIVPRLRLWIDSTASSQGGRSPIEGNASSTSEDQSSNVETETDTTNEYDGDGNGDEADATMIMASTAKYNSKPNILWALQSQYAQLSSEEALDFDGIGPSQQSLLGGNGSGSFLEDDASIAEPPDPSTVKPIGRIVMSDHASLSAKRKEIIIPLASDTAFYQLLTTALRSLEEHQIKTQEEFSMTVEQLGRDISNASRPSTSKGRSDLYAWRSIFQLWIEAQIFESTIEKDRGEREVEEAEKRLTIFANEVTKRGLGDGRTLKSKESRSVLERFLQINVLLLDLKKFQRANAEAARKILKKHEKRTALIFPPSERNRILPLLASLSPKSAVETSKGMSLAHILVVQLTNTLLPVIPSIEDYECLICTSIAFIPIRLQCSHLFCVRCLVKMQKRGQAECPLCRAPTVLQADRTNVDEALKRFMKEWFPLESKEKRKANEQEASDEQLREMGIDPNINKCIVM